MKQPETSTVFCGVDGRSDAQLPAWYAARKPADERVSFAEAVRDLPQAAETRVAYHNPYADEWVETERFNAVVEPLRMMQRGTGDQGNGDSVDPLFHIPTNSYAIINPVEVYGPLEEILREEELDGRPLGDVVFGEVRQYRGGGEVHMDIMFDGLSVTLPDRAEPITMGVTSGYDFFGGHAVYVEGFARDNRCANSIRRLTDRQVVKHVGDVDDFHGWWEHVLGQVELIADDLLGFIVDAQELTVDFTDVPFDLQEFYSLLGFPDYLVSRAASDARANASDPFEIDMWSLHSGATYALTHFFSGKEGTALDGYVRTANDILFNPETTVDSVERAYQQRVEEKLSHGGQTELESRAGLAQIERVGRDVREKADQFRTREETLRERLEM